MAGGTWLNTNKMLPGVYTNFSISPKAASSGIYGIVSLALILPWFVASTIIRITQATVDSYLTILGEAGLPLQEAFKNANEVLLYKLNAGTAATATIGTQTVTAKYGGTYGNNISIIIESVVGETGKYYVITYINGKEHERQKVTDASELIDNDYILFTHSSTTLTTTAGTTLSGGADGTVTNSAYVSYLQALELYHFNAVACTSSAEDIKALYIDFTKRLINDEGRYHQLVVADSGADFEGIISVKNGVTLADGTIVSKENACAYIAGATAAVDLSSSLTNAEYLGAVDVSERYTTAQQISMVEEGQMIFVPSLDNKVYIQMDINTLKTFTDNRNAGYKKNKVIRTIYAIANEIDKIAKDNFIGKVLNNDDGHNLLKSAIIVYLQKLTGSRVIKNVEPDDIQVSSTQVSNAIEITYAVQPIDTIDVIYNTIVINM